MGARGIFTSLEIPSPGSMKNIYLLIICILVHHAVRAQDPDRVKNDPSQVHYGINLTEFHTGSGHGSSYVINTSVQKGRKSLEMGVIYQDEQKRLSGGNVKYKIYLGKKYSPAYSRFDEGLKIRPYLHYNCIYHSTRVNTPDLPPSNIQVSGYLELPSSPGTIASMEHYAGMGFQASVVGNFCLDASVGAGGYIGSIDKVKCPNTWGIHKDNYGYTLVFELGVGYKFGI
jgi:hypothetical protein